MSLQIRGSDGRAYRPGRDISYLFPGFICRTATARLAQESWNAAVRDYAAHAGMTNDDLVRAAQALAKFVSLTVRGEVSRFGDAIEQAGFVSVPGPAQLALFFEIGIAAAASFFHSSREVVEHGKSLPGADAASASLEQLSAVLKIDLPSARRRAADELNKVGDNEKG